MFIITCTTSEPQVFGMVDAPQSTPDDVVLAKYLASVGVEPDGHGNFAVTWCPLTNWIANVNDVDTPLCELAGQYYVGTTNDIKTNRFVSGPHKTMPPDKTGRTLWQRSEYGEKFEYICRMR
jgi:hypothetical protein